MRLPKRCGNCGSTELQIRPTLGPFPWKDYGKISLTSTIELPVCSNCNEVLIPASATRMIDDAVRRTISKRVEQFISEILRREKSCNQTILANRMGKAPEYLSAIKSGAKVPSYSTYTFLRVLAKDPEAFKIVSREETQEINLKELRG